MWDDLTRDHFEHSADIVVTDFLLEVLRILCTTIRHAKSSWIAGVTAGVLVLCLLAITIGSEDQFIEPALEAITTCLYRFTTRRETGWG